MRRTGVAFAVLTLALVVACGAKSDDEAPRTADVVQHSSRADADPGLSPRKLVEVDDGVHLMGLYRSLDEPDCFNTEFGPDDDPDSWVTFGDHGCMGDRVWYLRLGTGGDPGSVTWTIIVGVTRPAVERVAIVTASGVKHERATAQGPHDDLGTFSIRLDEEVRRLEAYGAHGKPLDELGVPSLLPEECDWICRGQGSWATAVDPRSAVRRPSPDPERAVLAADERLRTLFEGRRFELWGHEGWHGCGGLADGATWTFMPDDPEEIERAEWPTIDSEGNATTVAGTGPPDLVTVDLDLDRKVVVSILPYYSIGYVPGQREHPETPLVDEGCRER